MKFSELNFDNHFKKLGKDFFTKARVTPLKDQFVAAYSSQACQLIDLDEKEILKKEFLKFPQDKKSHKRFCNLAMLYGGHQFGHLVGQLGDGRAMLLAQIKNKKNESWDLVLKGCGLTPYSRPYVQNADGKSVLRSAIREYLISEAMFNLGIPTSRALCLIASSGYAVRETIEPAAQIIRMAQSHIRFGTFEIFFYNKENDKIKILADYVIAQNFPQLKNNYAGFLREVVKSTATMIAKWQAFGFCHGVMNTDNMSILGITFDYGPFGFLDEYNPQHICNHSDHQGRYSFVNQPFVGFWNLNAFAVTLSSLISMEEQQEILSEYEKIFLKEYHDLMAAKLGFSKSDDDIKKLIYQLLDLLTKNKIDYTNFFRNLSSTLTSLKNLTEDFELWISSYAALLQSRNIKETSRKKLMNQSNPKFILRNYLLQTAISKACNGDFSEVKKLQKIMEKPFAEQKSDEKYAALPPAWAKEIVVSCSS